MKLCHPGNRTRFASAFLAVSASLLLLFSWESNAAEAVQTNGFRLIDLSSLKTASAALARPLSAVPNGLQAYHSVPFRIDSSIGVTGIEMSRAAEFFPPEISIRIGGKGKRLHLLHGTMFPDKDGVPLAKIIFHYSNGSEESVRLGYGVHVRDWIAPRLEKHQSLLDPNSQLAFSETDEGRGTTTRIFQTSLENPRPSETLERIDVVSLFSRAAPFILGMTLEETDSGRASKPAATSHKPLRELREFPDSLYRGEITVRVTDGDSGAPAKDATVSLGVTDDKEMYFFGEAKPDAQGMCKLPYPRLYAVNLRVWVHAPDRAPFIISESRTNLAKFTDKYSAVLKPGLTAGGVVKDTSGKPVSGAQVAINKITRISPHHYGRVDYDVALTKADGTWTTHCLTEDLAGLTFDVTHPDYRPTLLATAGYAPAPTNSSTSTRTVSPITYQILPDGRRVAMRGAASGSNIPILRTDALLAGKAEIVLQPAALLEGTLLDVAGKPVPSAEVFLQGSNGERKTLRTDANGNFKSRVAEAGAMGLIVLREGFAPLFQRVLIGQRAAPVELRLALPRVLHGRVQDRNQRPISGARVRLDDWNGTGDLLHFQTLTDAQGTFVWTNAPTDQVTFYVSKTNFNNTRQSFSGSMDDIAISINGVPGVRGRVYDVETKQPIPSFTVVPGRKYSQNEVPVRWDRSDSGRGYNGEYSLRMSSYYFQPEARVLVEAPGYEPQISRALNGMDSYECDFELKKGKGISGVVLLPDGSPAAGAALLLVERGDSGSLYQGGQLRGNSGGDVTRSDAQGHFEFVPKLDPAKVFASHEQGYAEMKIADVLKGGKIILQKWGRMKGAMRVGEPGETESAVQLQGTSGQAFEQDGRFTGLSFALRADPDANGNFEFDKVPPGEHRLAVEYRFKDDRDGSQALSHGFPVTIKAGETAAATLGGTGRRLTGRVKVLGGDVSDVDWKRDVHRLTLLFQGDPIPANNLNGFIQESLSVLGGLNPQRAQPMTAEAMRARQLAERTYVLVFDTNGVFHIDNVPPGKYMLAMDVSDPEEEYYNRRSIGSLSKEIKVPDEPNAKVNTPFDLGTVELTIHPRLKPGMTVPSFEAKTSEGKTINLSQFRGKPVLLYFWGLSLGYSSYDLQVLKEFQTSHGASGKLAIIGCNVDSDVRGGEQFAKTQGMTWTQVYLGNWSQSPVATMFGINGNTVSALIDPEGKLVNGQLRGTNLRTGLTAALSSE